MTQQEKANLFVEKQKLTQKDKDVLSDVLKRSYDLSLVNREYFREMGQLQEISPNIVALIAALVIKK